MIARRMDHRFFIFIFYFLIKVKPEENCLDMQKTTTVYKWRCRCQPLGYSSIVGSIQSEGAGAKPLDYPSIVVSLSLSQFCKDLVLLLHAAFLR